MIGGGTALDDAWAFGQWRAARRLVERGARPTLLAAAALGLPLTAEGDVTQAFWAACHGGQRGAAEALLARGADPSWVGWDGLTPSGGSARGRERLGRLGLRGRTAALREACGSPSGVCPIGAGRLGTPPGGEANLASLMLPLTRPLS